jgi:hypothetical protein
MLTKLEAPDRLVVMSSDSEGNTYSLLGQIETGRYLEEDLARGEVLPDGVDSGKKAIIFYPSH